MHFAVSAMEPPFEGLGDAELEAANSAAGGLFRGSAWLSISTVVTALGGLLFWIIAARVYSTREVGQATALFSAVLFVNYATNLGLGIAVARYSRDQSDASIMTYRYAIALASITSVLGSAVFLAVAPQHTVAPLYDVSTPSGVVLWLAIGAGMGVTTLVDVRLLALRMWPWVFARALAVSVIRVVLIAVDPSADAAGWTFLVAAGIPALSGAVGVLALSRFQRRRLPWLPVLPATRTALRYALANYAPVLAEQAPLLGLPLIVLLNVGATANANFYIAWGATLFVLMVPTAITQVLLVEGGRDGAEINHQTKLALTWSLVFMTTAWIAAWGGRDIVTLVYGESYEYAAVILPQFVAAGIAWSIMTVAITRARIEHDTRSTLTITVLFALTVLVAGLFWTDTKGVNGAVDAWLLGCAVGGGAGALFLSARQLHTPA
jgi:O-antigen/teichoic acid export membrane protein